MHPPKDLLSAFEAYKHPVWEVVGLYKAGNESYDQPTCDNYHLFNAIYHRIVASYAYELPDTDTSNTYSFVTSCQVYGCPGLYERFPNSGNTLSQDEAYGISYGQTTFSVNQMSWGEEHWYSYNLNNPHKWTLDSFLGRFPCFIGYITASAGVTPIFSQITWCIGLIASALTSYSETSGKMLSYLQIPTMSRYRLPRAAIGIWRFIMNYRYPGGFRQITTMYCANSSPNHPMTVYARRDWQ